MSLFDRDDPRDLARLDWWRRRWTPAKEEALQRRFVEMGLQTEDEFAAKMHRRAGR